MTNRKPLAGQLCLTAMWDCPPVLPENSIRHAVALDHAQELPNKHRQPCLLEKVEDTSVIYACVRTGKVGQLNDRVTHCTGVMCHGGCFDPEDVVSHLSC